MIRMTREEIADYQNKKRIMDEAQAAEEAAVYNLGLIRGLDKRVTELQELRKIDQAQAQWISRVQAEVGRLGDMTDEIADAVMATSTLLDEERRKNETLTRLVVRMGHELRCHEEEHGWEYQWDYTPAGQRQYDAAMKKLNEAEGEPEGHGLVEDVQ